SLRWRFSHLSCFSYRCMPFSFDAPAPTELYTLSLHDALPISLFEAVALPASRPRGSTCLFIRGNARPLLVAHRSCIPASVQEPRSEEHTSELQSRFDLVCRLLLEKKKNTKRQEHTICDIIRDK